MTLCVRCRYFITRRDGKVWYDQYCGASEKPLVMTLPSGETRYGETSHEGREVYTDERYKYARDINTNGHCPLYQEQV